MLSTAAVQEHSALTLSKGDRLQAVLENEESLPAIRESCRRSLFYFMTYLWDQISSDVPHWNWHIPYLCSQLMRLARRVAAGQPKQHDLIINIPPGTTKSMTCSIMFPAWCWVNWHWMRLITISYSSALSLELAEYSRDVIRSQKFAAIFPEITIKHDKSTKSNFRCERRIFNDSGEIIERQLGGSRYSTSVGGTLTGFHGHILIVDDPLDPAGAVSVPELFTASRWMDQTLSTRKVDKDVTPTVLIMQRLHQGDPTGHILEKNKDNVFHICLPGELHAYEEKVAPFALKEYYVDGLLDPVRMSLATLKDLEIDLGQYGYASQIGQNPTPLGGGMFKVNQIEAVDRPSDKIVGSVVRYWDKAGTADAGAYTVGLKLAKLRTGKYCIMDVQRGQWDSDKREKWIQDTAAMDGSNVIIWMEQEPGSAGKDSVKSSIRGLDGYVAHPDRPSGDKVTRADPFSVQVNIGNVEMIRGKWNTALLDELRFFPVGKYKDQVDALSGAYSKLSKPKAGVW